MMTKESIASVLYSNLRICLEYSMARFVLIENANFHVMLSKASLYCYY